MITIYHLENSRSERVIWLMEELGLPYELKRFPRGPDMRATDALRQIHPLGKSPIIRDGDTLLIESGAILEYIVNRHGGGRFGVPASSPDYAAYLQWMHFAEGSAMMQFVMNLFVGGFIPGFDQSSPFVQSTKDATAKLLRFLDDSLAGKDYFAGSAFSAADIMMIYCFRIVRGYLQTDMSLYPTLAHWIDRVENRPAYKKAMAIANEKAG
ncbi:MAG TPA: glutathione S-transferase [Alphaproteobacteria bacterium]|nr:glutathione S-transferase [Alphaproteobacteria bacterium]